MTNRKPNADKVDRAGASEPTETPQSLIDTLGDPDVDTDPAAEIEEKANRSKAIMPDTEHGRRSAAHVARLTIAPIFALAGIVHILRPSFFAPMMPPAVPYPGTVILLTGIAELVGAIGLFVPRTRYLAGAMLALYAVCVYPVNILHAVHDLSTGTGLGWAYHYPRLFAQPFICWWALAAGKVVGRPGSSQPSG